MALKVSRELRPKITTEDSMRAGSYCVVFSSKMDEAYHQLLEGYLQAVPSTSAVPLPANSLPTIDGRHRPFLN